MGKFTKRQDVKDQKKLAVGRIIILLKKADTVYSENQSLAKRYCTLARKIAMKSRVRIPRELKRRICKNCYTFLVPGKNCRIRSKEGHMVYLCKECNHIARYKYK